MTASEILGIIFATIAFGVLAVLFILSIIDICDETKEKKAKQDEEKVKLERRLDKIEYYLNVLWWEHENNKKD